MKFQTFKGYFLAVFSGLVIAACVVLAILQWGNLAAFSWFGKNMQIHTIWLILLSALAGVVLIAMIFLLRNGFRNIKKGKQAQGLDNLKKLEKKVDKIQDNSASAGTTETTESRNG